MASTTIFVKLSSEKESVILHVIVEPSFTDCVNLELFVAPPDKEKFEASESEWVENVPSSILNSIL